MTRLCFVGFDSAWTDKPKQPGAVAAAQFENGECVAEFAPRLARFSEALEFIEHVSNKTDYTLIALDQPSIVPNRSGGRPVERVARSIISGVQPARREVESMFGDSAPIWNFLRRMKARQNPPVARAADTGRFLIEVFPALSIPSLAPCFWSRKRPAKYNPANKNFVHDDWVTLTTSLTSHARRLGMPLLADWLSALSRMPKPSKSDQDRLDGAICLLLSVEWRLGPSSAMLCVGDAVSGFIVAHAAGETRERLVRSAAIRGVPIDGPWPGDAQSDIVAAMPMTPSRPRSPGAKPFPVRVSSVEKTKKAKISFDESALRAYLIAAAQKRREVTYGETASHFGHPRHQGTYAALTATLNRIAAGNKARGEPLLMVLVVNQDRGLPGPGFFREAGLPDNADRHSSFIKHRDAVFGYRWA